jgi:hypothetical protein
MSTADPVQNYTLVVHSGETVSLADATYDYRYYRLNGLGEALSTIELNGQTAVISGYSYMDCPIYSLSVIDGEGVMLFGTRSVRSIFGN